MSITPSDILADGVETTTMSGKTVRKGTIAAFLANIEIFENADSSEQQQQDALAMLKVLAPDVMAIGLTKYVEFKNPTVRALLS